MWFIIFSTDFKSDGPYDGSAGKNFKTFTLAVGYIAFFIKILLAIVFWKDHLDFTRVIEAEFEK